MWRHTGSCFLVPGVGLTKLSADVGFSLGLKSESVLLGFSHALAHMGASPQSVEREIDTQDPVI